MSFTTGTVYLAGHGISDNPSLFQFQDLFWDCFNTIYGEFDPGSGRTLATCLRNASRTDSSNTVSGERSRNT
jgi:hypothetical protein